MVHRQGLRPTTVGEVSLRTDVTENTHIMMVNLEAYYVVLPMHIVPVRHHVPIHTVGNM
jgi:hypothetical protein